MIKSESVHVNSDKLKHRRPRLMIRLVEKVTSALWPFWRCCVTTVWIYKCLYGRKRFQHHSRIYVHFENIIDLLQRVVVFSVVISFLKPVRSHLGEFWLFLLVRKVHALPIFMDFRRHTKRNYQWDISYLPLPGSYNYALAKWLDEKLKPLSVNRYTISDTFSFAEEIQNLVIDENDILVSFDVTSLFTDVALALSDISP